MDNNSYPKIDQIARRHRIHRNPERLRALLRLQAPRSQEESAAQRYGKCAHPLCGAVGTSERPLDLHHIIPRSQSRTMVDEVTNHLYLCGDFFGANHHKALHGESTPGKADWLAIGIFGDWVAEAPCVEPPRVDDTGARLVQLSGTDRIASALLKRDIFTAYDYAIKKGLFPKNSILYPEDIKYITEYLKNNQ